MRIHQKANAQNDPNWFLTDIHVVYCFFFPNQDLQKKTNTPETSW